MLKEIKAENIYIVCGQTDMRKSIDGLAAIVEQKCRLDLFTESLFLFCGRKKDRLKALFWELNLTHKISNEIDTVEDKKQLNEPLPNDL